jgi:GT2 family glycosyltransferase
MPKVATVVLNWNAWDITFKSLESLRRLCYPNYEVILVDNGSTTKPESLEARFPDLHFIETGSNLGFTGGNNTGIKAALSRKADFVLILNNDVLVRDDNLLMALVSVAHENPAAGIIAPRVVQHSSQHDEIEGRYFGRAQQLMNWLLLPRTSEKISFNHSNGQQVESANATQVCGCAMLISRTLLETVGTFDERLFMYDDEYDLCLRAIEAGFQIIEVRSTSVTRLNVCSQADMPCYRTYLVGRNRFLLAKKQPQKLRRAFVIFIHLGSSLKLALILFQHKRWQELCSLFGGLRDGILSRWGITSQLRDLLHRKLSETVIAEC